MDHLIDEILDQNSHANCNCSRCRSVHLSEEVHNPFKARLRQQGRELETETRFSRQNRGQQEAGPRASRAPIDQELEIVGDDDDRTRIYSSTHKVPFRWICRILVNYRNPSDPFEELQFIGTGVLVSPRHVLTCGHNIFNSVDFSDGTKNVQATSFEISPGMRTDSYRPFGTYTSTNGLAHRSWRSRFDNNFDLGMIKLDTAVGNKKFRKLGYRPLGYWGSKSYGYGTRIIPFKQSSQKGKKVNLAGYPLDDLKGDGNSMWWDADHIVEVNPAAGSQLFYYKNDTCGGHSGSPIWLTNRAKGMRFLIGIHTGPCIEIPGSDDCEFDPAWRPKCRSANDKFSSNRGVFLDKNLINLVRRWIRKM